MCGICGTFNLTKQHFIDTDLLKKMVLLMKHRGPDEFGIYKDAKIGMGHARLSIIDLKGGRQPIHNEDKTVWIVFNGEIFNYIEIREELLKKGHKFITKSDTEVLVHLYEEKGFEMFKDLNGQFAIAIWDRKNQQVVLARDRVGIRPLFYTTIDGQLLFASEIKAIFADTRVKRELNPQGLDQIFTCWANIPPTTSFIGINELPPAHFLVAKDGQLQTEQYWSVEFNGAENSSLRSEEDYAEEFLALLKDSINLRLRADVPVAAYLSGGIDSSFISALVKKHYNPDLRTFSVSFSDGDYDESEYQQQMANMLGTEHRKVTCDYSDISKVIPEVVWHAERPLIRTAPAPLFLLARLVRKNNIKVVLTGEGADEILGGYDLFREMKIRRFWARNPHSRMRPLLMRKLYSYIPNWPKTTSVFLEGFYRSHLNELDSKHYSHIPRWDTTSKIKSLFSQDLKEKLSQYNFIEHFDRTLPGTMCAWDALGQAQYIEIATLLSGNLLSSQGDRMMMAHSVEGRFPFLDYRLIEFCAKLPANLKIKGLAEKYLLKKAARDYVPQDILKRPKQAYRAPDAASFFNGKKVDYVDDLLSESNLAKVGYFDQTAVDHLVKKCRATQPSMLSAKDNMAAVGLISTLLLHKQFIKQIIP